MLDGARHLFYAAGHVEEIHFVVFVSNFVGYAACPGFNFVESILLLVVPRLTHIHVFAWREPSRSTLVEAGDEHDEAAIQDVAYLVVTILSCLHHFMFEKVLLMPVNCLFWSVVPACIDPLLPSAVLPGPKNLCNYGLGQVVRVANVDPVALDAVWSVLNCHYSLLGGLRWNLPTFQLWLLC